MNKNVISTSGLTKMHGSFTAVNNLDLAVPAGSICGFLGQNGAGKSTTIKMLLGMVQPTSGNGEVLGLNIKNEKDSLEIRKRVAYVAEDKRLYDYMTVGQIIRFTRSFFENWNEEMEIRLLKEFNLPSDRKIKKLSKGMRTQLALLLGLCRNAEILILDEPFEGLDPVNNEKVLELLVSMSASGVTVFFSSHQVFEVEQIADHIIMLHKGQIVDSRPLDEIKSGYKLIKLFFDTAPDKNAFEMASVRRKSIFQNSLLLFVRGHYRQILEKARQLNATSTEVIDLTLKDIFIENLKSMEEYDAA